MLFRNFITPDPSTLNMFQGLYNHLGTYGGIIQTKTDDVRRSMILRFMDDFEDEKTGTLDFTVHEKGICVASCSFDVSLKAKEDRITSLTLYGFSMAPHPPRPITILLDDYCDDSDEFAAAKKGLEQFLSISLTNFWDSFDPDNCYVTPFDGLFLARDKKAVDEFMEVYKNIEEFPDYEL